MGQLGADLFGWRRARTLARLSGMPAGICGASVASYTGTLLAATSVPLWATAVRVLPALFAVSATATASLSLILDRLCVSAPTVRRLERLALLASMGELTLVVQQQRA